MLAWKGKIPWTHPTLGPCALQKHKKVTETLEQTIGPLTYKTEFYLKGYICFEIQSLKSQRCSVHFYGSKHRERKF